MIPLTEAELFWARREAAPPSVPLEDRLARIGYIACPGAYARGCLALIPSGSGMILCQFCRGTVRRNSTGRAA